jgi:hypothetical protein
MKREAANHEKVTMIEKEKTLSFEQQIFQELSTEAQNVNYRNPQFQKQFNANNMFEATKSANAKLNCKLEELYIATSDKLHLQLTDLIALDFKRARTNYDYKSSKEFSTADSKSKNVHISCITSMLSDIDSNVVIDRMILELEKCVETGAFEGFIVERKKHSKEIRIIEEDWVLVEEEKGASIDLIDVSCLQCLSAHNFYRQVALSLRDKIDSEVREGQRSSASSNTKNNNAFATLIKDAPLMAIAELLSERENGSTIMIVLRHAERLNLHVFGELIELMHRSSLKAHFVIFCSSQCSLPLM